MAGVVVDSGKFTFKGNPRFPLFNEPDVSYHGVVFADLGEMAFISRLRALITRDIGACLSASAAHTCLQVWKRLLCVCSAIAKTHLR